MMNRHRLIVISALTALLLSRLPAAGQEKIKGGEAEEDKDTQAKLVAHRCLQSLNLDCRTKGYAALHGGEAKKAILFFEIAVRTAKVVPAHLGYLYFYLASAYALDRNEGKAIASLAEAVKAGFKDTESLEKSPISTQSGRPRNSRTFLMP